MALTHYNPPNVEKAAQSFKGSAVERFFSSVELTPGINFPGWASISLSGEMASTVAPICELHLSSSKRFTSATTAVSATDINDRHSCICHGMIVPTPWTVYMLRAPTTNLGDLV